MHIIDMSLSLKLFIYLGLIVDKIISNRYFYWRLLVSPAIAPWSCSDRSFEYCNLVLVDILKPSLVRFYSVLLSLSLFFERFKTVPGAQKWGLLVWTSRKRSCHGRKRWWNVHGRLKFKKKLRKRLKTAQNSMERNRTQGNSNLILINL